MTNLLPHRFEENQCLKFFTKGSVKSKNQSYDFEMSKLQTIIILISHDSFQ